ncbi:hypothetical protein TNCV_4793711 [Trichonephila clavipes]|nr:hypothetical protein TNCV_4793711 [Trichonephila clavipes]
MNWPPRSCDLTPLDYFLWGYVKSLVYADKPQTLDHLEDNIRRVIADIRPQMLEKVIENWTSRVEYIRARHGSHMPEIIFKMGDVKFFKWAGHLAKKNEDHCCKKIFLAKPIGNRHRGRPPFRWIECVEKDLKILKVKNWKKAKSRDAWRRLLKKARAVKSLKKKNLTVTKRFRMLDIARGLSLSLYSFICRVDRKA